MGSIHLELTRDRTLDSIAEKSVTNQVLGTSGGRAVKVFISWSGEMSRGVASALHEWLPYFIQALKPFVSTGDITKGARWGDVVANELEDTNFGIICITPYNIKAPWLNFESGALAKSVARSSVVPLLFLADPSQIHGPLAQFQSVVYKGDGDGKDIFNLLVSINRRLPLESQLEQELLWKTFSTWWPHLRKSLEKVARQPGGETETGYQWMRTPGDMERIELEDCLETIMVVSPSPYQDLQLDSIREVVKENIKRNVHYTVLVSSETDPITERAIKGRFPSHLLTLEPIDPQEFQSLAVTHYLLLNHQYDDHRLRVFLELPVVARGYWIEVSGEAAVGFAVRFRELIKRQHAKRRKGAHVDSAHLPARVGSEENAAEPS